MSTDAILAIIFIIILFVAGAFRVGLKKPLYAKLTLGVGALALTGISYLLNNNTVPLWMLALSGLVLLADAWFSYRK